MKLVVNMAVLAASAAALAACSTTDPAALQAGVEAARVTRAIYCNGITEEARQAVRDQLTGGVKVLQDCGTPATAQPAAP